MSSIAANNIFGPSKPRKDKDEKSPRNKLGQSIVGGLLNKVETNRAGSVDGQVAPGGAMESTTNQRHNAMNKQVDDFLADNFAF